MKRTPDDRHSAPDRPEAAREPRVFERLMSRRAALSVLGAGSLVALGGASGATRGRVFVTSRAGGPTGWKGAQRYQYPANSAPGRAVTAAKKLRADGKAPDMLVIGMQAGAVGNYTQSFPTVAKNVAQMSEDETGISLKLVGVDPAQTYAHDTRLAAMKEIA
jgi:multiple sugar transport system substrate-binding protein